MAGASATQSSTSSSGGAERAIDGNASPIWGSGSCTHTSTGQADPWWTVNVSIAQPLQIARVDVTNRGDCCPERLSGFNLTINGITCASSVRAGMGQTVQVACAASVPTGDLQVCAAPARSRGHTIAPPSRLHTFRLWCAGQDLASWN